MILSSTDKSLERSFLMSWAQRNPIFSNNELLIEFSLAKILDLRFSCKTGSCR